MKLTVLKITSRQTLKHLCVFSSGYGLKCYYCVSTESWNDCADVKKEVTCDARFDRCVKAYADVKKDGISGESYSKGCLTEALCNSVDQREICSDGVKCKVYCCTGDFCNDAAVQMVSAIILMACAFVAALIQ